uniref:Neuron navigator 1 n=1 Tax=Pelodiscus sinensis TaxID=13735 RepID=K7FL38_PELSI
SSLEMTCYDSDEANARSVSSLSNRSSPLSWRYGQSGGAPGGGRPCRSEGTPSWYAPGERAHYSHTMPMRSASKLSHISRLELVESLDADDVELKSGYMSDSDLLGKTLTEDDDITTGWDESSSISSGLSDASDNLSSEEFNASSSLNSLPSSPTASRRNSAIALRTDSEKRSLAESGLSWYSEAEEKGPKKLDYDSGGRTPLPGREAWGGPTHRGVAHAMSLRGTFGSSQRPVRPTCSGAMLAGSQPCIPCLGLSHSPGPAVPPSRKPEAKATDKSKLAVKNAGLQRSSSDAGRDRLGDAKKPPSGLTRPSTSGSFGYKNSATVMQAGGSATLGKIQKSSGIPVKPINGRKTSLDVSNAGEPGFLAPGARSNIQYRRGGGGGRGGTRPVSSSIDPSLLSTKQGGISVSRLKEPSKIGASRSTPAPVNQTDREKEKAKAKAVALDSECVSLKSIGSPESTPKAQASHPPPAKVAELPPTPLRAPAKSYVKPPSLANLDKVNSNSLDLPSASELPPPHASKRQDLHRQDLHVGTGHLPPCFTPSPAPILNINSASFSQGLELMSGFSVPKEGRMYPKLSGLHRSMESLQMPISLPSAFPGGSTTAPAPDAAPPVGREEETNEPGWTGSPRTAHLDSTSRDRNTLPKKGLRYQLQSQEETKERRHSHTIGGLPESDDPSELPSPAALSVALAGKGPLTNIVSPTSAAAPRITRSNSIPTHDSAFELYSTSQTGSTLSLADRPKGMIRSGSFRDPTDDGHGTSPRLGGSAFPPRPAPFAGGASSPLRLCGRSVRWACQGSGQGRQQSSVLANLVAAFEQSLVNMTSRLRQLAETAEEKDTELLDLRETIDFLKKKNSEAQAVIQGALNGTDVTPKELRIKRQNSSDSISSLSSIPSHSSIGSGKDADAKKKKKKSWVYELRSSFNKAFSIKKGPKSASSYSDIEEIATPDSSAPSSPKLQHGSAETASPSIKSSNSSSVGIDATDPPGSPLHTHGDEGLQCQGARTAPPALAAPSQGREPGSSRAGWVGGGPGSPLHTHGDEGLQCQGARTAPPALAAPSQGREPGSSRAGSVGVGSGCLASRGDSGSILASRAAWASLGQRSAQGARCLPWYCWGPAPPWPVAPKRPAPDLPPAPPALLHPSVPPALRALLPHPTAPLPQPLAPCWDGPFTPALPSQDLQLYLSNLANQIDRETGIGDVPLVILLDDLSEAGSISELVNGALTCKYHKWMGEEGGGEWRVSLCQEVSAPCPPRMLTFSNNVEPANGFLVRYLRRKLLESDSDVNANRVELLRVLDWVPKLWYHLHTFLEKHSTSDFLIGPCFFLSCPIGIEDFRTWFIDLWNNSIIPYLQEGAKDGIKVPANAPSGQASLSVHPHRATPPAGASLSGEAPHRQAPVPTRLVAGAEGSEPPPETHTRRGLGGQSTPLPPAHMAMLLKLQEAANYIESPDRETMVDPNLQPTP